MEMQTNQITFGPSHHIFGYIGRVQNIPWNESGEYILALRFDSQDRMPRPDEYADVILLDAKDSYSIQQVDRSLGWNIQQGTMFYWNPYSPETQFFFNDRDPETNKVFTVLFDIVKQKRIREFRFDNTPFGNSGVAQNGGEFLGINYARLARLRAVTGYPGAFDWTVDVLHPEDDGVFKVDISTGQSNLIVSFRQLRDALVEEHPHVDDAALFINHTLWNREGDLIYFYARGNFSGSAGTRANIPFTVRPDGSELTVQEYVGGHPEWDLGHRLIGTDESKLILYDTELRKVVEEIGDPSIFPKPGGDNALSPDGNWLVSGYGQRGSNAYVCYRRSDGFWARSGMFDQQGYTSGDLRSDPAPCWNREGSQVLFPSLSDDGTRQLFVMDVPIG